MDEELRAILDAIIAATSEDDSCDEKFVLTSKPAIDQLRQYLKHYDLGS